MAHPEKLILLETNRGNIQLRLWPQHAPKTCENFEKLATQGYYNGIIFHRVIREFMIQGGDPTGTGSGGQSIWGKPFEDECVKEVKFDRKGLLAMANAGPGTNGSQFFITTAPTPWLHMRHTLFGEVVEGYPVVAAIENCECDHNDRPRQPQQILKATLIP